MNDNDWATRYGLSGRPTKCRCCGQRPLVAMTTIFGFRCHGGEALRSGTGLLARQSTLLLILHIDVGLFSTFYAFWPELLPRPQTIWGLPPLSTLLTERQKTDTDRQGERHFCQEKYSGIG